MLSVNKRAILYTQMKMSEGVRAEERRIQMHGRRETEITPDRRTRGVQLNFSGISSLSWD